MSKEIRQPEEIEEIKLSAIDDEIRAFILEKDSELTSESKITYPQLLSYRLSYIRKLLENETLRSEQLNQLIYKELKENKLFTNNSTKTMKESLTIGQKTADKIVKMGGSRPFIFIFILVLILWISLNTVGLFFKSLDTYPFILLNLALSCFVAIQAPIILMSRNREEERSREQTKIDYKVNLKAEVEINLLHEKMAFLINDQWQHLVEIQNIQLELLEELQEQLKKAEKEEQAT